MTVELESQFKANETAANQADTTDAINNGEPNYRAPFKFAPEQGTDLSSRFIAGASLSVIQRLENFCDDVDRPTKSVAFLVPYGYSSSPSTVEVELPQRSTTSVAPPEVNRVQQAADAAVQTTPDQTSPWDFEIAQRTLIEEQAEEEEETTVKAQALRPFDAGNIDKSDLSLLTTIAGIKEATEPEEEEEDFTVSFTPSNVAINTEFPEGDPVFGSRPRFVSTSRKMLETVNLKESSCGEYEDLGAFVFLFNPQTMDVNQGTKYSEADTWGDIAQGRSVQWQYNENLLISLNQVEVQGLMFRRIVQPIVDEAFDLVLRPSDNGFEPIVWSFIWGERVIEPVIVESVRVQEKAWYKGKTVWATLSMVLKKVPDWQVNDGLNVIVFNELLQSQLNQDPDAADPDRTDADSTAEAINRLFGGEFKCAGLKQCTTRDQFNDQRKKFQEANKTPTNQDADKFAVLTACINTSEDKEDEDKTDPFIEDPTKCTWDSCCQLLQALVKDNEEARGAGAQEVNARCDEINFSAIEDEARAFLGSQIDQICGNDFFDLNSDAITRIESGARSFSESLPAELIREITIAGVATVRQQAERIEELILKMFTPEQVGDAAGLLTRIAESAEASNFGIVDYMITGRNVGLSTFADKFNTIQGFSRTIIVTQFFPAEPAAQVNGASNTKNFTDRYFRTGNTKLLEAARVFQDTGFITATDGTERQKDRLREMAGFLGQYLDEISKWQTEDGIKNALNIKARCDQEEAEAREAAEEQAETAVPGETKNSKDLNESSN